ncbi:hypothetical protein [Serratia oryzae]|uniref:Uncharacterized protein n=1 Tax=Serratia oryzae TaxID=2034155 RepID=A0A1S8CQD8_9GAMM|nr:hypothetical protein [Serratia oryzae]OMQ26871.1 hypothetical protein BMI79_00645 [Serratia oryzae]
MNEQVIKLPPVLITREKVQQLLGGMSRTTFWRRKKQWAKEGKPFPSPAPGTNPINGGEQYRFSDVMRFFRDHGFIDDTQADI